MKHRFILLLLATASVFAACKEEEMFDDPFDGSDSYIAAFSLQQGETVFHAAISGDLITVTAPEGLSLSNAKATVKLSENATIYPDPSTITDWESEHIFVVTAYNSEQIKYKYTVERNGVALSGTVILETQAELDAFGQQGITFLDGSLIIGRTTGVDSITSLAPLAGLKEIAYSLTLNATCAIAGLEGLEGLEYAGVLQIGALPHLEILTLPALKTAGSVTVQNTVTFIVEFPALERVSKLFSLNCPLYRLSLPQLQKAGSLTLAAASNASTSLAQIDLPALKEVEGNVAVSNLSSVTKLNLPELKKAGGFSFNGMTKLSFIYALKLEETTGTMNFSNLSGLTELNFPELKHVSILTVSSCKNLSMLELPKLEEVTETITFSGLSGLAELRLPVLKRTGSLTVSSCITLSMLEIPKLEEITVAMSFSGLTGLSNLRLPALKQLGTTITVSSCEKLSVLEVPQLETAKSISLNGVSLNGIAGFTALQTAETVSLTSLLNWTTTTFPAAIQRIDALIIDGSATNYPAEINIKGKNIGELRVRTYATQAQIIGDDVFSGLLFIEPGNTGLLFPELEGFKVIDSLYANTGTAAKVHIKGIRKVNKGVYLTASSAYPQEFSMPDMEEAGGNFTVNFPYMTNTEVEIIKLDKLKRVGGNCILTFNTKTAKTLSCPELTTIEGNFSVSAGYDYSTSYIGFETLHFPQLTTISGKLTVYPGIATMSRTNTKLKNLDGFSALTEVREIEVNRQAALTDYSGLKNAFPLPSPDNWIISGNSYNPTYQDLLNDKWSVAND
jgi:hypothetical protein